MNKVIVWTITAAITLGFAPSVFAFSVEQLSLVDVTRDFVVGPGKIELQMEPGDTRTFEITVTNRMGEDRRFNVTSEDFEGSRDTTETVVLLGGDKSTHSLKDAIRPEMDTFVLKHGERARLPITIKLPANAEPGGRYASVLIDTVTTAAKQPTAGASGAAALVTRIGTLVFVRVPGEVNENGQLKNFSTIGDARWYGSKSSVPFTLLYENNGSVHLNPYGYIHVTNLTGSQVARIKVDPWFSLPDSLRTREVQWQPPFLFGRYTATAEINRGYGDVIDTATFTFWVVPWKLVAGAVLLILILVILVKIILSRFEFRRKV